MMFRRTGFAALAMTSALLFGCAEAPPEEKKPAKDEFVGFGALRGEPREKKSAPAEKAETGDEDGNKGKQKAGAEAAGEEKTALTKEQVLGALGSSQKKVDACLAKFRDPGIYVVEITIAQNGTCSVEPIRAPTRKEEPKLWAEVEAGVDGGKNPKSPTNRCIASAITQVKFPAFEAEKPLVVTYPIVLR